ncbi:MAG: transposase [Bdellovibrionales bacterium]|nr:transposase [Bdellovibrionales bacterium]
MLKIKVLLHQKDKNGVLYDRIYSPLQQKPKRLRHIMYRDPLTRKIFHFITSDFKSGAMVIAGIYKRRWAMEHLFRWLKGDLNVRRLPTKKKPELDQDSTCHRGLGPTSTAAKKDPRSI